MPRKGEFKEIDEEKLRLLASFGLTLPELSAVLEADPTTISKRYHDALEDGWALRNGSLRRKQFELAMKGNVTMLIWLGKNCLGQTDKIIHAGDRNSPLQVSVLDEIIGGDRMDDAGEQAEGPAKPN